MAKKKREKAFQVELCEILIEFYVQCHPSQHFDFVQSGNNSNGEHNYIMLVSNDKKELMHANE